MLVFLTYTEERLAALAIGFRRTISIDGGNPHNLVHSPFTLSVQVRSPTQFNDGVYLSARRQTYWSWLKRESDVSTPGGPCIESHFHHELESVQRNEFPMLVRHRQGSFSPLEQHSGLSRCREKGLNKNNLVPHTFSINKFPA